MSTDPSIELPSPGPLLGAWTETEWVAVLGCIGFSGAVAMEMSTPDETHPGVAAALMATTAARRALGEDTFGRLLAGLDDAVAEEKAAEESQPS